MTFDWTEEPGPWNEWRLFDKWREQYDTMSLQDQTDFHSEFYKRWTVVHQHGDDRPVDAFFNMFHGEPVRVLEIGGWDGAAAARILPKHGSILEWLNVEICLEAVQNAVVTDERYVAIRPVEWPWDMGEWANYSVLFMQHVAEHMKFDQFKSLVGACVDAEWVFVQSPLPMGAPDWTGYPGCHIIEVGWEAIDEFMSESGFDLVHQWWDTEYSTAPENGRTRIYRRSE